MIRGSWPGRWYIHTDRRFTRVHLLFSFWTRDFNLWDCSRRNSLTLSLLIVLRHELANAISASVIVKNLRVVHASCPLCACLTLVGVSILHEISFRDVSSPINSRNSGHHDHRRNTFDLPLPQVQQVSPDSVDPVSIAKELQHTLH